MRYSASAWGGGRERHDEFVERQGLSGQSEVTQLKTQSRPEKNETVSYEAPSKDGARFAAGCRPGSVRVFETKTGGML